MGKQVKWGIKMAIGTLACSCMMTGTVSAAPVDELIEILGQMEQKSREGAVLSSWLGLEELGEAVKDHGLRFDFQTGISTEAGENPGLPEELVNDSYYRIQMQIDPENRQWLYDTGYSLRGMDFAGLVLYGDSDMLTFSLPHLYGNALGIRSGNLYEQIEGSWAVSGDWELPEQFREIELDFFPDEAALGKWKGFTGKYWDLGEISDRYDAIMDSFRESLEVTKEQEDGESVYAVTVEWEDLKALYQDWLCLHLDIFKQAGAYADVEYADFEEQVDEMFREAQRVIEKDPVIEFYVSDGELERVSCEMFADTTVWEETESESDIYNQNREEEQTALNLMEDFGTGYLEYEIVFREDTEGMCNTDINFYIKDEEKEVQSAVYVTKTHMTEETEVIDYLDVMFMKGSEAVYYCNLFNSVFDPADGSLDVRFSLTDQDTEDTVYLELSGTFTEVVPGQGFTLNFDRCSVGQNYEDIGALNGKIRIEAQPGEIEKPQKVQMIFDMTQEEIDTMMDTIYGNIEKLLGAFRTEEESEYSAEI